MIDVKDKEFIKDNAVDYTIIDIMKHFDNKYTKIQIKNFCTNNNIKYKLLDHNQRSKLISINNLNRNTYNRTRINKDYFKTWSNNMAYIFGLWCADGYILRRGGGYFFSIKLKHDDRYLLERILLEMDSEHKIYERNDNSCEICFSCKEIYNDIVFLGGMEKKSLIMRFPNIPHDYVKHFTRGYFDGDGSVNKRNVGYLIGTYEFCNSLNLILRENGIRISSIKQKHPESGLDNNCYCLNIFKKLEFEKFEQFMCGEIKNNSLLLTRKHQNNIKSRHL